MNLHYNWSVGNRITLRHHCHLKKPCAGKHLPLFLSEILILPLNNLSEKLDGGLGGQIYEAQCTDCSERGFTTCTIHLSVFSRQGNRCMCMSVCFHSVSTNPQLVTSSYKNTLLVILWINLLEIVPYNKYQAQLGHMLSIITLQSQQVDGMQILRICYILAH